MTCNESGSHYCLEHFPPPAENPERLQGPEVGTRWVYQSKYEHGPAIVTVVERSYVWAPGDPSYKGGSRRYDWKVVEFRPGRRLVVDDKDLQPLVPLVTKTLDRWVLLTSIR